MKRSPVRAVAGIGGLSLLLVVWLALPMGCDSAEEDSGQPQTPTALGAGDLEKAFDAATTAVRETMRQPEYASGGPPRAVEPSGLQAKRDGQGNWYGKLWTASGTGMTGDGSSFTWTAEVKNEGGEWSSVSPAVVNMKP